MYFIYMFEDKTLKPVKIIWSKGSENDGGGGAEPNQGTLQAYMEMSEWNPLYS
jgi:hypothetical protein